ncbi:hypothetical protein ABID21_004347 [Pseudorhizobium tarimense]|uniref:Hemerythrin-like domain-containing protein n=1 Tax=Pseudorhizobium tarimense TaxID=1079109 RepID=A0ABV2HCE9_9HYPH|nr:hemerythrin domain-containing protein [Pseudorhizobium tarimense]MCJ8521270.1 hemerythrin domain-containing protein [Pseudorhizobium tarimense]
MTFTINFLDDSTRPRAPKIEDVTAEQRRRGRRLAAIHAVHLRQMSDVRSIIDEVAQGLRSVSEVTYAVGSLAMSKNTRLAGTICGEECQMLTFHHTAEDQWNFPALTGHSAGLTRVVERLAEEHLVIHALIERLESAAAEAISVPTPASFDALNGSYNQLEAVVKSHFSYEQEELEEALGFYDVDL